MLQSSLTVRELEKNDINLICDYWFQLDEPALNRMGVDPGKIPNRKDFENMLFQQYQLPYPEKRSFGTIWEKDGNPIGHCNTNPSFFGDHAWMHLHIWSKDHRKQGIGRTLVHGSLAFFFEKLQLQYLICEPYALNPAPNRVIEEVGFRFVKEYRTIPGSFNFEQMVKRWELTREEWELINNKKLE